MRNFIIFLFLYCASFTLSCKKKGHQLRVTNNFPFEATVTISGQKIYPRIASGTTTDYQPINQGSYSVMITPADTNIITETQTIKIEGEGEYKWTVTLLINANYAASSKLTED